LNKPRPTILKIGGSAITDKSGELVPKTQIMDRLADETKKADLKNLIIVHGGGSFGHPTATKYGIKEGYKNERQKIGFAETHQVMAVLNGLVMDALVWHEVPAVGVSPSSCIVTKNGRIELFEDTPMKNLVKMGFCPVMFGDAVLDSEMGFTILSGDQLVSDLAIRFDAERIIMGVDEDGLYDSDPKANKDANMYDRITLEELRKLNSRLARAPAADVTGGMHGKISELIPAVEKGIPVTIINATEPNNVYKILAGEKVKGTLIEKE
jgi:isopentenyl phosphate kinase